MNTEILDSFIQTVMNIVIMGEAASPNQFRISANDAVAICREVQPIFEKEKTVIDLVSPINICGDIHGQLADLVHSFQIGGVPPRSRWLFLGDFVDRGPHSIEVITLLFALKIRYPAHIYLIRGNHESPEMTENFGFLHECVLKFNILPQTNKSCSLGELVWLTFCDVFEYIPVAAVVGNEYLCIHGGISPKLEKVQQIRDIKRPLKIPQEGLITDLFWSDPSKDVVDYGNSERGSTWVWGKSPIKKFLKENKLKYLIRGHQFVTEGYDFPFFPDKCVITMFSASNYAEGIPNKAAFLVIDSSNKFDIKTLVNDLSIANSSPALPTRPNYCQREAAEEKNVKSSVNLQAKKRELRKRPIPSFRKSLPISKGNSKAINVIGTSVNKQNASAVSKEAEKDEELNEEDEENAQQNVSNKDALKIANIVSNKDAHKNANCVNNKDMSKSAQQIANNKDAPKNVNCANNKDAPKIANSVNNKDASKNVNSVNNKDASKNVNSVNNKDASKNVNSVNNKDASKNVNSVNNKDAPKNVNSVNNKDAPKNEKPVNNIPKIPNSRHRSSSLSMSSSAPLLFKMNPNQNAAQSSKSQLANCSPSQLSKNQTGNLSPSQVIKNQNQSCSSSSSSGNKMNLTVVSRPFPALNIPNLNIPSNSGLDLSTLELSSDHSMDSSDPPKHEAVDSPPRSQSMSPLAKQASAKPPPIPNRTPKALSARTISANSKMVSEASSPSLVKRKSEGIAKDDTALKEPRAVSKSAASLTPKKIGADSSAMTPPKPRQASEYIPPTPRPNIPRGRTRARLNSLKLSPF